ncbi:Uncharacterized membrane protein [Propionibacterium cyclohexanicum]|uniref:Uncharacterized membrane protein n=1 Tax=Propionibacterium cyclohexanicum TaxID=64702 RepID=A0A1H9S1Z8_9ACTN|nr:vitamin K epoxide reductase family protein [Propionibacterium cyclohexanicum]SER79031.1 Uncharacterized membrane protein [Propionibacterium cyclohexanicum]
MTEVQTSATPEDDDEIDVELLQPAPQSWRSRTAIEMVISGLLGLYTSFVLSIEAWQLASNPGLQLRCDVNSVISCTTVANTWQARVLGFPNAFLGIFFEAVVLAVSVAILSGVRFPRWYMLGVQALYTVGLLFALWLFVQSYFVIHALCPWCLLITLTTTLVWAGLTRLNVRDRVIPAPAGLRWFVSAGNDWIITGSFLFVLAMMVFVRYGITLLR